VRPTPDRSAQLGDAIAQRGQVTRRHLLGPPLGGALFGFGRALILMLATAIASTLSPAIRRAPAHADRS